MFIVHTYSLAVLLCLITMLCWGSWPNTQKLVSKDWRFELFYWDYVLGIVLISLLAAVTLGSFGTAGRPFITDLMQSDLANIFSAALGGLVFNAANILFVAAISMAGMSVAFPVAAGIGLVLGVLVNYFANPQGKASYLCLGVMFIIIAISMLALAYKHLPLIPAKKPGKGLLFSIIAGVLFGFFYRFVSASMATDFLVPEPGKSGPYVAVVCFSTGVLISNLVFNSILMKRPVGGKPLSFKDYRKGTLRDHSLGILGGVIWGTGLVFSILSSDQAGFAVSFGLSQGNALVAALWGVFVWKEFKNAPSETNYLLAGMFACYISGLLLLIFSRIS